MRLLVLSLLVVSTTALAQDPGMQAAQMASDAAMQASQMATQAAMTANQMALDATQNATQQALLASQSDAGCATPTPKILLNDGPPKTVLLTDKARHVVIFYTTDGWTPNLGSAKFDGPIPIDASTLLQVVAFEPGCGRSRTVVANYIVNGTGAAQPIVAPDGVLKAGTPVMLQLASEMSSKKAKVGDVLELTNAVPLEVGGRTLGPGLVKAQAVLTEVHRGSWWGTPGEMAFVVKSLALGDTVVPLHAERMAEAPLAWQQTREKHPEPGMVKADGKDVVVPAGSKLTATVVADTKVSLP